MTLRELLEGTERKALGEELHRRMAPLFPLTRSLTGYGVRETLRLLAEEAPLELHEVPTGTRAFDWEVPREWNLRDAWIRTPDGRRVGELQRSNLHVVGYSVPVRARLTLAELRPHLHSLPDRPDWVPYRTSYYREDWGFCLPHRVLESLPAEGEYEVCIDSKLAPGRLTYGELLLPGASEDEVLVTAHVCHPSLANDNLSALVVVSRLARDLARVEPRRYSYRFLFAPGTIGALVWLARNQDGAARRVRHGLVAAGLGDAGRMSYKRSRRGTAEIDRAAAHVLRHCGEDFELLDFVPFGYDERQFNSPGFDLPVGSLTRTPHGRYPEYHTSADDLAFVRPESLAGAWARYLEVFEVLEGNARYRSINPHGEPQLGRRGLYRALGGGDEGRARELALLWVLNQADGEHSLLDTAERAAMPFPAIRAAADALLEAGLLEPLG